MINRAFAEGLLSWTKVRELIKVAGPDHDDKWLEQALRLTADELALEVRLSKPGQPPRRRDERKGLPEVRMRVEASVPPDVYAMI